MTQLPGLASLEWRPGLGWGKRHQRAHTAPHALMACVCLPLCVCAGLDSEPYGVDPVFKMGTSLYNPDLLGGVTARYNCSLLPQPTYNVEVEGSPGVAPQVTNPPPYCAELYSPRSLPYGFHASSLNQFGEGFPMLFDINLDAHSALAWLSFIQVGPDACPPGARLAVRHAPMPPCPRAAC